jgi:hypothetical protein
MVTLREIFLILQNYLDFRSFEVFVCVHKIM